MQNFLYNDMQHQERMKILIKTSIGRETMTFKRSLTPQDLEDRKDLYTREAMRLATVKEYFKGYKTRKAADIKAIEKNQEDSLEVIANESIEVFDEVFLIPNYEKGLVLFVDKHGEIVHQRELKPDERQGVLFLDQPSEIQEPETEKEFTEFEEIPITGSDVQTSYTKESQPSENGTGEKTAAPKKAAAKKTSKKAATSVADVAKEIVDSTHADPEAMERVKDWNPENESI